MKIKLDQATAAYLFTAMLRRRELVTQVEAAQRELAAIDQGCGQVYRLLGATGEGWRLGESGDGGAFLERADEGLNSN
jgi:hypothetical protein